MVLGLRDSKDINKIYRAIASQGVVQSAIAIEIRLYFWQ
jgi:hypothetical protein